jgi:hypothetical protein
MKPFPTFDPLQKAYVCNHVFDRAFPVMLVSRPDGDWCFLCGQLHDDSAAAYKVVGIGHVLEEDSSLTEVTDLESDWEAERSEIGGKWLRTRLSPDG